MASADETDAMAPRSCPLCWSSLRASRSSRPQSNGLGTGQSRPTGDRYGVLALGYEILDVSS